MRMLFWARIGLRHIPQRKLHVSLACAALLIGCSTSQDAQSRPSKTLGCPSSIDLLHVNALSGFNIHDGASPNRDCTLLLAGERISGGPASGVVLRSKDGGKSFEVLRSFDSAAEMRCLHTAGSLNAWVGGQDDNGKGLLEETSDGGGHWVRDGLPDQVLDVTAIASRGDELLVAAVTLSDSELMLRSSPASPWVVGVRVTGTSLLGRISRLAEAGPIVAAVGMDGSGGVAYLSLGAGAPFTAVFLPRTVGGLTAATFGDSDSLFIGGYGLASRPEERSGLFGRTTLTAPAPELHAVPGTVQIADLLFRDDKRGVATVSSGSGDQLLTTMDGGRTWDRRQLHTALPPVFERIFAGARSTIYVVGESSGLFETNFP